MNLPEAPIPPLKRGAALLARLLPAAWRFPICGLSAGVCGGEAMEPLPANTGRGVDPALLSAMAGFFGPDENSAGEPVRHHMAMVPHGIAWSRGAALTADGSVIEPLSTGMTFPMEHWLLKRQRFFPRVRREPGLVVSLATDGHNNFYHWMLDLLPKLFVALALGLRDSRFYVGASHRFQHDCLDLLGITPGQVLDANAIPFLQAEELIVPFLGEQHPPNVFSAAKCRLLVDVFSPRINREAPGVPLPARFVVSRARTRSRRLINEAELLAHLAPLGFVAVYLEDFSLLEQMTLFARAEAIAASTGAGLTNLIHARAGTPVAILMPEECPDLVCRDIAAFAGLRCEIFYGRRHPFGTADRIGCDMVFDQAKLASIAAFFAS